MSVLTGAKRVYLTAIVTLLFVSLLLFLFGCTSLDARRELAIEYYNLGNAYYEIKVFDKAILFFNKSISLDPDLLHAHFNLSLALINEGRGKEADTILLSLAEKDPLNISILQTLGYSYYMQGRVDEALELFEKILSLSPENPDALYNKAVILWDSEKEVEAKEIFLSLVSALNHEDDLYYDTLFNLGELSLGMGKSDSAVEFLREYLEWRSEDTAGYLLLAKAYKGLEKYNMALEAYSAALSLDNNLPEAWFDRAEILLTKVEDPVQGLDALAQALTLGFKNRELITLLLDNPTLIEKASVEAALEKWNLLPGISAVKTQAE